VAAVGGGSVKEWNERGIAAVAYVGEIILLKTGLAPL
jgi:hypothetical protein